MSMLGSNKPEEDVVLVFRPPENPAAQIAGITPFKSLRLRLEELLDWFKGLNVDSIDLWIEGAWKSGNRTELFLSVEGKTGAKITLRPFLKQQHIMLQPESLQKIPVTDSSKEEPDEPPKVDAKTEEKPPQPAVSKVTALFSPAGGVERHIVSLIDSAVGSIEMAAYEFTNLYIEKAILEAIKRGVKVDIVLDKTETQGLQAFLHDKLEKAGAEIRLISPRGGIMHDKYIIIDGKTVEWGSYNYTERAENKNFENVTIATDSTLAQQYHTDFASIFGQAKPESKGVARDIRRFFRHFASKPGE